MTLHPLRYGSLGLKSRISQDQAVQILSAALQVCTHLGIVYDEDAVEKVAPIFLDIVRLSQTLADAHVQLIDKERLTNETDDNS